MLGISGATKWRGDWVPERDERYLTLGNQVSDIFGLEQKVIDTEWDHLDAYLSFELSEKLGVLTVGDACHLSASLPWYNEKHKIREPAENDSSLMCITRTAE